jgi:hypothetical protein
MMMMNDFERMMLDLQPGEQVGSGNTNILAVPGGWVVTTYTVAMDGTGNIVGGSSCFVPNFRRPSSPVLVTK